MNVARRRTNHFSAAVVVVFVKGERGRGVVHFYSCTRNTQSCWLLLIPERESCAYKLWMSCDTVRLTSFTFLSLNNDQSLSSKSGAFTNRMTNCNYVTARWNSRLKPTAISLFHLSIVIVNCEFRSGKMESTTVSTSTSAGPANWCVFGWLLGLAQLLLHGALGLVLFWVVYYRQGFGWRDEPKLEFNYHPVLMIGGFIYLVGNGSNQFLI